MSPTPVTFAVPTAPATYSWEATDEEVAARYGMPVEDVIRFDLNTSPAPPSFAQQVLAAGRFESPMSEYAPSDYRRLVTAAAARYGVAPDEILVGAGADEVLDIIGKTFLPAGARAAIPVPTYAMYRVITEQRGAIAVTVPRLGAAEGYAIDLPALRSAARSVDVVWLCNPNNPTALAEPDGAIETLLGEIAADARTDGRIAPIVVVDEAYFEFTGRTILGSRDTYPRLIVIRTASKAYGLAGLRVGFGLARPEIIAAMNPFRPPGSVSTVSATVVAAALSDPDCPADNIARVETERTRLSAALGALGWTVGESITNFLLVEVGTPERAAAVSEGLLAHGLVPRTFSSEHPLAGHLRLTVRAPHENDRLIEALRALDAGTGATR